MSTTEARFLLLNDEMWKPAASRQLRRKPVVRNTTYTYISGGDMGCTAADMQSGDY